MLPSLVSARVAQTISPVVVTMAKLMREAKNAVPPLSLAQGQVYWDPPEKAVARASKALSSSMVGAPIHRYGAGEGSAELRRALIDKLDLANKSNKHDIMVTQGANQAIFNALVVTTDSNDIVGLMEPYYFNHHMAITQLSCRPQTIKRAHTMHPDVEEIKRALADTTMRALIITNPCNPTGTLANPNDLQTIAKLCESQGCALILDNTYEDFIFDSRPRPQPVYGPNVFNVFSFSKNFGMSGWRMGYLVYPNKFAELMKVQDTVVICPSQLSQEAALGALEAGDGWIQQKVQTLYDNRSIVRKALERAGIEKVCGGEGGIFFFAKLPHSDQQKHPHAVPDDWQMAKQLINEFGIAVIPGESCGMPGWLRVSFANLSNDKCIQAAERLERGLTTMLLRNNGK